MFPRIGVRVANVVQGVLLTIVPWVLVFFGPKIRARSKFASVGKPRSPWLKLCSLVSRKSCTRISYSP